MQEFAKSGHAVLRCSSPFSRGVLKRKGKRKKFQFTTVQKPTLQRW